MEISQTKNSADYYELTLQVLDKSNKFKKNCIKLLCALLGFSLIIITFMGYEMVHCHENFKKAQCVVENEKG